MNFNFLRVHGSGIIATDEFYDLCDRMGMMVWQEFLISNMSLSGVHVEVWRTQAEQAIMRLRNHPSLVYWCGGNEFNPDDASAQTKQIVDMLEQSVGKYDGDRPFSRSAQYVNDPHYNDQSGAYGGLKIAACSEYSGGYAGNLLPEALVAKVPAGRGCHWLAACNQGPARPVPAAGRAAGMGQEPARLVRFPYRPDGKAQGLVRRSDAGLAAVDVLRPPAHDGPGVRDLSNVRRLYDGLHDGDLPLAMAVP